MNEIIYICPKCGAVYKREEESEATCGSCGVALEKSGYSGEVWYALTGKERQEVVDKIKSGQQISVPNSPLSRKHALMVTSGYSFEGYRITNYLGFCTGTCVLGTGFLSTLNASFADFFGGHSSAYASKLEQAKTAAESALKDKAVNLGANAIIGIDLDYTTFSADIIGVIANGTAVYIERTDSNEEDAADSVPRKQAETSAREDTGAVPDVKIMPQILVPDNGICRNCGNKLDPAALFCAICGTRVEQG